MAKTVRMHLSSIDQKQLRRTTLVGNKMFRFGRFISLSATVKLYDVDRWSSLWSCNTLIGFLFSLRRYIRTGHNEDLLSNAVWRVTGLRVPILIAVVSCRNERYINSRRDWPACLRLIPHSHHRPQSLHHAQCTSFHFTVMYACVYFTTVGSKPRARIFVMRN